MPFHGVLQLLLYMVVLLALAKTLGRYMARVYEGQPTGLDRVFGLSDSTGEINGVIPSNFVDSACTVRTGAPEPIEMQGIHHSL